MGTLKQIFSSLNECMNSEGGCGLSHISLLIQAIINSIYYISLFIIILAIFYMGYLLLTNKGNMDALQRVKSIAKGILIGVILVFGSYGIVNNILKGLGADNKFIENVNK